MYVTNLDCHCFVKVMSCSVGVILMYQGRACTTVCIVIFIIEFSNFLKT